MKKFIFKILIYITPIIVAFFFLELFVRNYKTESLQKKKYFESKSNSIELLILGNSHALNAVDPTKIKLNTFNAAMGSQSLFYDISITKKYLKKMNNLKFVLISVDYHSLYFTHRPERDFLYKLYYDISFDNSNDKYFSYLLDGYGLKTGIKLIINPSTELIKGWGGHQGSEDFSQLSMRERANDFGQAILNGKNDRKIIIQKLESFIQLLQKNNIEPVIFSSPTYSGYNIYLDSLNIRNNIEDIDKLCCKYNIQYWRFNEDIRFLKEDFYNQDHLNTKGAAKFSAILNEKLENFNN